MKITKKTLCAMRSIIYIGKESDKSLELDKFFSIREIARCQKISVSYLEQVLNKLKKAKIIVAKRGPNGGYRLFKEPSKITLLEVVELFEKNYKIANCEKPGATCTGLCTAAKPIWDDLNESIHFFLKNKTIRDYI